MEALRGSSDIRTSRSIGHNGLTAATRRAYRECLHWAENQQASSLCSQPCSPKIPPTQCSQHSV